MRYRSSRQREEKQRIAQAAVAPRARRDVGGADRRLDDHRGRPRADAAQRPHDRHERDQHRRRAGRSLGHQPRRDRRRRPRGVVRARRPARRARARAHERRRGVRRRRRDLRPRRHHHPPRDRGPHQPGDARPRARRGGRRRREQDRPHRARPDRRLRAGGPADHHDGLRRPPSATRSPPSAWRSKRSNSCRSGRCASRARSRSRRAAPPRRLLADRLAAAAKPLRVYSIEITWSPYSRRKSPHSSYTPHSSAIAKSKPMRRAPAGA